MHVLMKGGKGKKQVIIAENIAEKAEQLAKSEDNDTDEEEEAIIKLGYEAMVQSKTFYPLLTIFVPLFCLFGMDVWYLLSKCHLFMFFIAFLR